jgi:hypothetical protein
MGKGGQEFCSFEQDHGKSLPDTLPRLVDPTSRLQPSFNVGAQPLQALVETVSTRGTSGLRERKCMTHERSDNKATKEGSHLDVPRPLTETLKTKLICNLRSIHGVG